MMDKKNRELVADALVALASVVRNADADTTRTPPTAKWAQREDALAIVQIPEAVLFRWVADGKVRTWKNSDGGQRGTRLYSVEDMAKVVEEAAR